MVLYKRLDGTEGPPGCSWANQHGKAGVGAWFEGEKIWGNGNMAAFPPHFVWALILNKELSVMGGGKIPTGAG